MKVIDKHAAIVTSGLSKRWRVKLSNGTGVTKPLSLSFKTYGTEQGSLTADDMMSVQQCSEGDGRDVKVEEIRMGPMIQQMQPLATAAYNR